MGHIYLSESLPPHPLLGRILWTTCDCRGDVYHFDDYNLISDHDDAWLVEVHGTGASPLREWGAKLVGTGSGLCAAFSRGSLTLTSSARGLVLSKELRSLG